MSYSATVDDLRNFPHSLEDDELREQIAAKCREVKRLWDRASDYYGNPCQEGKRRYDAYKAAKEERDLLVDVLAARR